MTSAQPASSALTAARLLPVVEEAIRQLFYRERPLSVASCLRCVPREPWMSDELVAAQIELRQLHLTGLDREREAELVAGYAEFEFVGFLTVTAADEADLARACAEYEQAAAQCGLEIRALDGRHDIGFVCALPIGRGLAARRGL